MAESEEEVKNLSVRVKEESENAGLKLGIHKTKTMASSPITYRWGNNGNSGRVYVLGLLNHSNGQ